MDDVRRVCSAWAWIFSVTSAWIFPFTVPTSGKLYNFCPRTEALARFFDVQPLAGDTIATDGKVLRGSYQLETDNPDSPPHPAIQLVSAYLVERDLILEPYQVESKTNEIKALPEFIERLALKGSVFAFDAIGTQQNLLSHR